MRRIITSVETLLLSTRCVEYRKKGNVCKEVDFYLFYHDLGYQFRTFVNETIFTGIYELYISIKNKHHLLDVIFHFTRIKSSVIDWKIFQQKIILYFHLANSNIFVNNSCVNLRFNIMMISCLYVQKWILIWIILRVSNIYIVQNHYVIQILDHFNNIST